MRNAGGAGRHTQQPVARLVGGRRRGRGRVVLSFAPGNGAAEGLGRLALAQAGAEIGIQKQRCQFGQHLHMQVVGLGGGGDEKQHLQRLAVGRIAGQRRIQRQCGQLQFFHRGALGVGNRQPIAHADAAQFQPGADIRRKDCRVRQDFGPIQQRHKLLHRALQGIRPLAQCDTIRPQVVGNAHRRSSVY